MRQQPSIFKKMAKKVTQIDIEKVQEKIRLGRLQIDKGLHLIEELEAQIQTLRKEREARKQSRPEKKR
jgi:hypothetical protein